jgi:hypothetical protein
MKPVVDGLEVDYGERVVFMQLDAENAGRDAFVTFGLRGHPSFVIIDTAGEILWQSIGEQPRGRLEQAIRGALGGA